VIRRNAYEDDHIQVCGVEPIFCALEAVPEGEWLKVLFATSADVVDAMAQDAAWKSYPEVSFVRSSDHFYEMLPAGVTKGSALAVYRQMLYPDGITTVAVGDYQNDLEMIVAADFGAVPSNGQACVKAAADYVLERSCDSGAVAELIAVINSKISKTEVLPWM
jgi:hydroxymethylpyrimidine pyrophosphatase-like HAD family hydrolase